MKRFICKYGLYHDREVINQEPRSNNGWCYTSYAAVLNFPIDLQVITETFHQCFYYNDEGIYLLRLPRKFEPPISRDEVLGMVSLFPYLAKELIDLDYFFLGAKPSYIPPLKDQLKAVWSLRNKHRNFVWEQKVYKAYPIVFRLWWNDRYYLKKLSGVEPGRFETIFFYLNAVHTIIFGSVSVQNILWLQLKDLKSKVLVKFIPQKTNFIKYFGSEHPFNQK